MAISLLISIIQSLGSELFPNMLEPKMSLQRAIFFLFALMFNKLLNKTKQSKKENEKVYRLFPTILTHVYLINEIYMRRLRYAGHAVRHSKTSLMSSVLLGKIEGKCKRGRPAKNLAGNLIEASRRALTGPE